MKEFEFLGTSQLKNLIDKGFTIEKVEIIRCDNSGDSSKLAEKLIIENQIKVDYLEFYETIDDQATLNELSKYVKSIQVRNFDDKFGIKLDEV